MLLSLDCRFDVSLKYSLLMIDDGLNNFKVVPQAFQVDLPPKNCPFFLLAFMARSSIQALSETDVTPACDETLDFDNDTLRGEEDFYLQNFKSL